MMTQQMPEAYVPVLRMLHEASQESYDALLAAVELLDEPSGIRDFADRASQSTELARDETQALLSMLLWAVAHAETGGSKLGELIGAFVASEELALGDEDQQRLASRVLSLADRRSVRVLYKSLDLIREHRNVFVDARVVTDVRPVFGGDIAEGIDAVVLTHSLKLEFVQEDQHKSFHVALDQSDIHVLRDVLERAIDKAASLRELLESAGISNLTLEP